MTQQRFDSPGRLVGSRDPHLFALAQTEERVPENLNQSFSLSGVAVLTDSLDAGWRLALPGSAGQIVERWDGRGSHSLTEYDPLLRPVVLRESSRDVTEHTLERFTYAGAEAIAHNLCGQLMRHDDPAGTLRILDLGLSGALLKQARQFLRNTDPPNWPNNDVERDHLLEPGDGAITWNAYAPTGEPLRQTDALGNIQAFAYTVDGQLKDTRLTLAGDGQVEKILVSAIHYNAKGQIESETAGNKLITRHHYDEANGRLTELSAHKADGTPLQDLNYHYDAVGNVLSIEDAAQPIRYFNNQRIEPIKTYRYDTLYQLIHATGCEAKNGRGGPALPDLQPLPPDPNQIANYTQTYYYDAGGNLLDLVHVGAQAHGRTLTRARYSNRCLPERDNRPPTEDELANGFDANGNLRELQVGQSLGWDLRNQLREVRPVVREDEEDDCECYIYDGSGQRVRKVRSSQTNARTLVSEVRYLPGLEIRSHSSTGETLHVIAASAGSNSVQVLHWATRQPEKAPKEQVRYCLGDHLKSSTLELDQNAGLISQEWYYPFGGTAYWAGRDATEANYKIVRYSGKERDATGLYYYGFRYYAPWLQRWINPDPAGYVDGMNLFSMVNNNPVTYIDMLGKVGDDFNHKRYLEEFKTLFDKFEPENLVTLDPNKVTYYRDKISKIESIRNRKEREYFNRQIRKLGKHLPTQEAVYASSKLTNNDKDSNFIFFEILIRAKDFKPFDNLYQQGYRQDRATGATPNTSGSDRFHRDQRPRDSSSSQQSRRGNRSGSNGPTSDRSNTGYAADQPNQMAYTVPLPLGTDTRIIQGYELSINIINNPATTSTMLPEESEHETTTRYRRIALLIHPDRLHLDSTPDVAERATQAFQIVGQRMAHLETLRVRRQSAATHQRS
ncbi:RHS repeat-associated core domain-containing protein [Pseudomonas sp. XS1P51]